MQALTDANELLAAHSALILRVRSAQQIHRLELKELDSPPQELLKLPLIPNTPSTPPPPPPEAEDGDCPNDDDDDTDDNNDFQSLLATQRRQQQHHNAFRTDLAPAKRARAARYLNYVPEEETIRNDYSQRFVDSGEWPQNWVLGAEPEHRFEEYPKQKRLLELKKASVNQYSLPPTYLPYSDLTSLNPTKFDVILLDPPFSSTFTWDHLQELPIPSLASDPSFVFLWVGSGAGEGLERGREVLAKWGYRRCEDVVWIKTNKKANQGPGTDPPTTSIFTRTKQHCLMGIRGTVRRSTDSWFVHCNVDTDIIIWEGDPSDPTRKPPEMFTLIENFCLGMRKLEVFGKRTSLRRGWVTVFAPGQEDHLAFDNNNNNNSSGKILVDTVSEDGVETRMVATRWVQETWEEGIKGLCGGGGGGGGGNNNKFVVPMTPEIDTLRPKSPVRSGQSGSTGGGVSGGSNQTSGGGSVGGPTGVGGMMGVQGMPIMPNPAASRFTPGGQLSGNVAVGTNHMLAAAAAAAAAQNQMMMQPMMGMNMNMGGAAAMGMGGMEDMMGNWNNYPHHPMMVGNGMGGMNVGMGMGAAGGGMQSTGIHIGGGGGGGGNGGMTTNRGLPNAGLGISGMGPLGLGGAGGQGMHNANAAAASLQMMSQMGGMGVGNAFQPGGPAGGGGGGGGGFAMGGMGGMGPGGLFDNSDMGGGWGDPHAGHGNLGGGGGMEAGGGGGGRWDEGQTMMNMVGGNINPGMSMGGNMGMGMGQSWG